MQPLWCCQFENFLLWQIYMQYIYIYLYAMIIDHETKPPLMILMDRNMKVGILEVDESSPTTSDRSFQDYWQGIHSELFFVWCTCWVVLNSELVANLPFSWELERRLTKNLRNILYIAFLKSRASTSDSKVSLWRVFTAKVCHAPPSWWVDLMRTLRNILLIQHSSPICLDMQCHLFA